MTVAKAKARARANKTLIVQASLIMFTYDHQNIYIVKATVAILTTLHFLCLLHMGPIS